MLNKQNNSMNNVMFKATSKTIILVARRHLKNVRTSYKIARMATVAASPTELYSIPQELAHSLDKKWSRPRRPARLDVRLASIISDLMFFSSIRQLQ